MNATDSGTRWVSRGVQIAARLLISQIFLISGTMKLLDPAGTQAHIASRPLLAQFEPWFLYLVWAAAAVELVAGLCVLVGCCARSAAVVLILYLLPVTFTFHDFWTFPESERPTQMFSFLHNIALMGGLLLLAGLRRVPAATEPPKA
jgi:putative oxidoreductase